MMIYVPGLSTPQSRAVMDDERAASSEGQPTNSPIIACGTAPSAATGVGIQKLAASHIGPQGPAVTASRAELDHHN